MRRGGPSEAKGKCPGRKKSSFAPQGSLERGLLGYCPETLGHPGHPESGGDVSRVGQGQGRGDKERYVQEWEKHAQGKQSTRENRTLGSTTNPVSGKQQALSHCRPVQSLLEDQKGLPG